MPVILDKIKNKISHGKFDGPIVSKCNSPLDSIILSNNISVSENSGIIILNGLKIGFKVSEHMNQKVAFSEVSDFRWDDINNSSIEYSFLIPKEFLEFYESGEFGYEFPFIFRFLHTSGLYLKDFKKSFNAYSLFMGEIISSAIGLIRNGIILSDRVVIDYRDNFVFYNCLIIGRDSKDELNIAYEPFININELVITYLVFIGNEDIGNNKFISFLKEEREGTLFRMSEKSGILSKLDDQDSKSMIQKNINIKIDSNDKKTKEKILIFVSYATKDVELFRIKEIAEALTPYEKIDDVLYWQEDMKDNIYEYMNDNLGRCDLMLLFCSPNSNNSIPVRKEWTAADSMNIPIIPIFKKSEYIPPLLKPRLGVEFDISDFDTFIKELFELILKKYESRISSQV